MLAERPMELLRAVRGLKLPLGLRAVMVASMMATVIGEGLADELGDCEWLGLALADSDDEGEGDSLLDGLVLGDSLALGETDPDGETLGLALLDGLMDGDSLGLAE